MLPPHWGIFLVTTRNEDDQTLVRAHHADELLKNPLLQQLFSEIEAEFMTTWRNTTALQTEQREAMWRCIEITRRVQTKLHGAVAAAAMKRRR